MDGLIPIAQVPQLPGAYELECLAIAAAILLAIGISNLVRLIRLRADVNKGASERSARPHP